VFGRFHPLFTQTGVLFGLAGLATVVASCARELPVEPRRIAISPQLVPSNDNFGGATAIAGLPFVDNVDITDATLETGETPPFCAFGNATGRTVWYSFTPSQTGWVSATINAGFNTVVAVDTGSSLTSLIPVVCRSVFGGTSTFQALGGTTYYFQVDGMFGGAGALEFRLEAIPPPPNDDFANATPISALPYSNTVDLTAASREAGEPTPSCFFSSSGRTAWYSFTPVESRSISGSVVNAAFSTVVAVYTGTSVDHLTEVSCRAFGGLVTFRAEAGTTYYFQVDGLFGQAGPLEFRLDVTPLPVANFSFFPFDPSVFDVVQFFDQSFDPGGVGFQVEQWSFGDGTTGTGGFPTHQYAADGDYTVRLAVTTFDGRTASTSQTVHVRTHDVAITKFSVPNAASAGQTRRIVVGISSKRYSETVNVQLLKSVPGGYQSVGSLTQSVPVRPGGRTTDFAFSYTFTADDARVGKVTFKASAGIFGARDALPADNEAIAPPTTVNDGTP